MNWPKKVECHDADISGAEMVENVSFFDMMTKKLTLLPVLDT